MLPHMWCMVVKLKIVIDDGVVGVVDLDEMLQSSSLLVPGSLDSVDSNGLDVDHTLNAIVATVRPPEA